MIERINVQINLAGRPEDWGKNRPIFQKVAKTIYKPTKMPNIYTKALFKIHF